MEYRKIREISLFAMFGTLMFCSMKVLEALPNIHLIGALTMVFTIVYRKKALIPIYVFVFLSGISGGFALWWIPYLYIWTVLWAVTMMLPKNMPAKISVFVYAAVCSLHGLFFGILYAPVQALMFHMSFSGIIKWIVAGFPFDCIHALGNAASGLLIVPLSNMLLKAEKRADKY